ncbi:sensor histidine kinase [Paenibacillus sp.]|uniref:sensor histidine kinase n=1 Tax=Paenibacillus sp. TaxID=58172 RepID=UPI002D3DAA37|nr:sensor histidine kinase [Paenibacillus sp.]HZG56190.1 sensor histidine kinase [Paenibacillus sp.]
MRRMMRWIRSKLLYKMVLIYSLLILVPLTLISTTFYLRSKSILEEKVVESETQSLAETADKIDGVLRALAQKLAEIAEEKSLYTLLRNDVYPTQFPLGADDRTYVESAVLEALHVAMTDTEQELGDYIDSIYIHNRMGRFYAVGTEDPPEYYLALSIMPYEREGSPEWAFFVDRKRMICNMLLLDRELGVELGFISLMLDPDKIRTLYESYSPNSVFITNSSNVILSADRIDRIGSLYQRPRGADMTVLTRPSRYARISYVSELRTNELTGEIRSQGLFAAAVTMVSWVVVVLITYVILNRITNPLRTLTRLMRSAERGDYRLVTQIGTDDEIAILCQSFNHLVIRTHDLIEKVYKTELLQKEAELKSIRMQFNPHFLYNTLEYISIMSKSGAMEHISDVVKKVAEIFRFSIAPGNPLVPLEVEIEFVRMYIQIHEFRFGERFRYDISVADELRMVTVPKLIFQPLIENAFIHGIDRIEHLGNIAIRAYELDFDLILEVEDNGGGWMKEHAPNSKGFGTGLENVRSRLRHHYGEAYTVELVSLQQGTLVRMRLPILLIAAKEEAS